METSTAIAKPEFSVVQKNYNNKASGKIGNSKSKETAFDSLFDKQTNQDEKVEKNPVKKPMKTEEIKKNPNVSSNDNNKVKEPVDTDKNAEKLASTDIEEQLKEITSQIKEKLMDVLDLSEDELNDLMEQMGLVMFDLADPNQLLKIILAAGNEEDLGSLLTNEDMGNQFKEMMNCMNQIKEQYSLSTEDLKNLLDQVKEKVNSELMPEVVATETKEANSQKTDANLSYSVGDKDGNLDNKDQVTISVVKEESQLSQEHKDTMGSSADQTQGKETDLTDQLIEHMVNASNATNQLDFSSRLSEIHETKSMVSQIVEQIKIHINTDQTSMEFTLNPESLGKVALNVTSRNGVLTASFMTQNQAAKEAIESQMQILKDNLNEQGLKVDAIEVTVSEFGFSQDNQMQQSKDQKNQSSSKEKKVFRMDAGTNVIEDTITEESKSDTTIQMGSQIDYSA